MLGEEHTFVVEGRGEFPEDMLRRDGARPATPEDEFMIKARLGDPGDPLEENGHLKRYRVTLVTNERFAPMTARWESFQWRVVEARDPDMISKPRVGRRPKGERPMTLAERQARHREGMRRRAEAADVVPVVATALERALPYLERAKARSANPSAIDADIAAITEAIDLAAPFR